MTITGSTNSSAWTYKLEATETSTSTANRTSTVQIKVYLGRANSQSYLGGGYSVNVTCAGQSSTQSGTIAYPTYVNGGAWLELKTFTFTVSNTGTPTTISISSSMSSSDFSPSYASASGTMQLTILHLRPTIQLAEMQETNATLVSLNIPDTTVVRYLSKKKITLHATAEDGATLSYRLEHLNTNYNIPTTGYQASNIFNTDYTQNDIVITNNNKATIIQRVQDSMGGNEDDWLYLSIGGTKQRPDGIPYTKPNLERTSTTIKRKSGNGTNLTDNKAEINLSGTIYKANDIIGNNNSITQIGYKIWEIDTSEPVNYTSLTPTIDSSGNVTVSNVEISNIDFTKKYSYKIILKDSYNYDYVIEDSVPLGQATWTEYKDRVDFLAITVGQNPIIESDSNADGEYIKFYDGTMICFKEVTDTVAITSSWGSLYEGSISLGNWAEEFTAKPYVQVTNVSGTGAMIEDFYPAPTKTNAGTLYLARPTTITTSVTISVIGIGKWK